MEHIYQQQNFGENWFDYGHLYTDMVDHFKSGCKFVEIGSWKGKSSSYMAVEIANSNKNIEFYCVDTFEGSQVHKDQNFELDSLYETFLSNMSPVKDYYKCIRDTSINASYKFEDESIDFIFIDGSHEYEDVRDDIIHWFPKLKKSGVIAGHDCNQVWPGVERAVSEYFTKYEVINGLWIVKGQDYEK